MIKKYSYKVYFKTAQNRDKINITKSRLNDLSKLLNSGPRIIQEQGIISSLKTDKYTIFAAPNYIEIESNDDYDIALFCSVLDIFDVKKEIKSIEYSTTYFTMILDPDQYTKRLSKLFNNKISPSTIVPYKLSFFIKLENRIGTFDIDMRYLDEDLHIAISMEITEASDICCESNSHYLILEKAFETDYVVEILKVLNYE